MRCSLNSNRKRFSNLKPVSKPPSCSVCWLIDIEFGSPPPIGAVFEFRPVTDEGIDARRPANHRIRREVFAELVCRYFQWRAGKVAGCGCVDGTRCRIGLTADLYYRVVDFPQQLMQCELD